MYKPFIISAAVAGMLAVIFGAFGAHALKARISMQEMQIWQQAVSYQFYHVLALLVIGFSAWRYNRFMRLGGMFFILGMVFFCGSLYLLSTRELTNISFSNILGPVTPLGGLFFIAGWFFILLGAIKGDASTRV